MDLRGERMSNARCGSSRAAWGRSKPLRSHSLCVARRRASRGRGLPVSMAKGVKVPTPQAVLHPNRRCDACSATETLNAKAMGMPRSRALIRATLKGRRAAFFAQRGVRGVPLGSALHRTRFRFLTQNSRARSSSVAGVRAACGCHSAPIADVLRKVEIQHAPACHISILGTIDPACFCT